MKLKTDEIESIKNAKNVFNDAELIIYFATAAQIQQLKNAGLSGISRKQKKD